MSLITPNNFEGKFTIANITEQYVSDNVQLCIDDYEPKLLTYLLGEDLYNELLAGLELLNKVIPSIKCYVYWKYQEENATQTTGTGETNNNNQNSTQTSPIKKMVDRWNEMVVNNRDVVRFIQDHTSDYGDYYQVAYGWPYHCYNRVVRNIFCEQNTFGI
jgi:hypothetical protein